MFEEVFKNKKFNDEKLALYGFSRRGGRWTYEADILGGEFRLYVFITESGDADTELIDFESGEPYILYKTNAYGKFIGEVRAAIQAVLEEIAEACCDFSVFKSNQARVVIEFIREKYGDELEFLWPKFPDNAVFRRKDNQKWYGAILTVNGRKIGLDTDKTVEIIDLRMDAEQRDIVLAREHYYPGWHMNKKSWYTIVLNGSVTDEEIRLRITESYELAKKS